MDWENTSFIVKEQFFSIFSIIRYVLLIPLIIIYLIVFYYQIIRGNYYYNIAEKNRLRMFVINAPRGIIYDVNNEILADNRPSITVFYYPVDESSIEEINNLLTVFPTSRQQIFDAIRFNKIITLGRDVEREKIFYLLSLKHRIKNVYISTEFRRRYLYNELFSHVIGYVGQITYDEYQKFRTKGYSYNDFIGKTGVEKMYEDYLRGINGALLAEVDAKGNLTKIIKNLPPRPGNNLYLTIDKDLQKVAEEALRKTKKNGAVVGIDPRDGSIRILVSYKNFDLNLFTTQSIEARKELFTDNALPLFNRAVQGVYSPGSTFKILTTIAALNEKKCSTKTVFFCPGEFKFGDKIFKCWEKKGHGYVDLLNGIRLSCNVYFINLGLRVGIDNIEKYAKMFGFGQPTGIDLPYEAYGVVPSRKWKKEKTGIEWFDGDTISVSIGQGYVIATTVQLAVFAEAVANKGVIYTPYLVSKIVDVNGDVLYSHTPQKKEIKDVDPEIWDFLHFAMISVVESGTGHAAYIPSFPIAGKTGTAQNPHGEDHAWFICFGPVKEGVSPELVLAIVVEHGGKGGAVAAPIAKQIFTAYINKSQKIKLSLPEKQSQEMEYGD
jgi:penicillin-binding protein 2